VEDKDIVYNYLMAPIKSQLEALAKDMLPKSYNGLTYDDLVDVAFNKVWERMQPNYLYIMAKNCMRDELKHQKAESFYQALMVDLDTLTSEEYIDELTGGNYDEFIEAAKVIRTQRRANSKTLLGYLSHANSEVAKFARRRLKDLEGDKNG